MQNRQKPKSSSSKKSGAKKIMEPGSGAKEIIADLEKHDGWGEFDKMAGFENGTIRLPGIRFAMLMKTLGDLARPDNQSPFMIEYVRVGKTIFLHLIEKPPQMVLDAMAREGSGNYSSSNDIFALGVNLDEESPEASPLVANQVNPYPEKEKLHAVFDLASEWIPRAVLLERINVLPNVNKGYATSLLHNLGNPRRNNYRSRVEERGENGVRMIRAVRFR